jgi:hypothetical protein
VTVAVPLGTILVTGNGKPLASGGSDEPGPTDADGHAAGPPFYVKGDPGCPDVSALG